MHRRLSRFAALMTVLSLTIWAGGLTAETAPPPKGPVVLTVSGAIERPNRGPIDPFHDGFFKYAEVEFTRAAEFDIAALEALGTHRARIRYPKWPSAYEFEGPLLRDVLAAAGAKGKTARVFALDGYGAEIPMARIESERVLLALKRDGRYLGLGGRGPAWVVFDTPGGPPATDDESQWVWSAYRIEIE